MTAPLKKWHLTPSCHITCGEWEDLFQSQKPASVDLLLTDPPYAIGRKAWFTKPGGGVERFRVKESFEQWDGEEINLEEFLLQMSEVIRPGGTAIIWYDVWKFNRVAEFMAKCGFTKLRLIIWEKTNPVPINQSATYLANSREIAVCGVKGNHKATFHGKYDNGIYRRPIPRHKGEKCHPTQKCAELFADLIKKHSNPGDIVMDPFLGSGTTAVAAAKTGRRFVGCDNEPKYADIAIRRVLGLSQLGLETAA